MPRPLPEKSPFLQGLWQAVLAKSGWSMKDLQRETRLSYNYSRHIAEGKIIPARNALWQMCHATGLDFERVWHSLNTVDEWSHGEEHEREVGAQLGASLVPKSSAENSLASEGMLAQLIGIFEQLPLAAQYSLMSEAARLAKENKVSVPGLLNAHHVHEGKVVTLKPTT